MNDVSTRGIEKQPHEPSSPPTGWPAGWTLTASPAELSRETSHPLAIQLSAHPMTLEVGNDEIMDKLSLPMWGSFTCRSCASGIRIQMEHGQDEMMASCMMLDTNCFMIEGDASWIQAIMATKELQHEGGSLFHLQTRNHAHILYMLDRHEQPTRLICLSGAGATSYLLARAHGYLQRDAHRELDTCFAEFSTIPAIGGIVPLDYLSSRLRASTRFLPYPWLANAQNEPVWDTALLYLTALNFLDHAPAISAGLILNQLENMDEKGRLPVGGGLELPVVYDESIAFPLLLSISERYVDHVGQWPMDMEIMVERLQLYIRHVADQLAQHPDDTPAMRVHHLLLMRELDSFMGLLNRMDKPNLTVIRFVRDRQHQGKKRQQAYSASPPVSPWVHVLSSTPSKRRKTMSLQIQMMDAIAQQVLDDPASNEIEPWALFTIVSEILMETDAATANLWMMRQNKVQEQVTAWIAGMVCHTGTLSHDRHVAGWMNVATWLQRQQIHYREGGVGTRLGTFARQHQQMLSYVLPAIMVVGFLVLIWIQFRPSMPKSVFDARIGLAIQHYTSGQYDASLAILNDMESSGAAHHPTVLFQKGKIYYQMQDYPEAIRYFSAVTNKLPDHTAVRYNLGLSLFANRDYASAISIFQDMNQTLGRVDPGIAARAKRVADIIMEMEKTRNPERERQKDEERGAPRRSG